MVHSQDGSQIRNELLDQSRTIGKSVRVQTRSDATLMSGVATKTCKDTKIRPFVYYYSVPTYKAQAQPHLQPMERLTNKLSAAVN